jgi:hypothetical protein
MKRSTSTFILTVFLFAFTHSAHAEYYLAKITDFLGDEHYQALSKSEFIETSSQIRIENTHFSRAQRRAEAKWNKEKPMRYPGRSLHQRKILSIKRFRTIDEANLAVAKKEAVAALAEEKKNLRDERNSSRRRGSRRGNRGGGRDARSQNRARRENRAQKQRENLEMAETYFKSELESLINAQKASWEKSKQAKKSTSESE